MSAESKVKELIKAEVKRQLNESLLKALTPLINEIKQLKQSNKLLTEKLLRGNTIVKKSNSLDDLDDIISAKLSIERKQTNTPAKKFSNNTMLNDILNETAVNGSPLHDEHDPHNYEDYPTLDRNKMAAMLGYGGMSGMGSVDMSGMINNGPSIQEMIPDKDVNGLPLRKNANELPDFLKKALTRNYSELVKVMDKDIKKRGLGGAGNSYT